MNANKCGIICEYNPFHNGHEYHLRRTRELTGGDIVCVMSGDFVQRAEPAVFDKRVRAEAALKSGADAVIELPALYATAPADMFAYGAVSVLASAGVKYLSFGVETNFETDTGLLKTVASMLIEESVFFKAALKERLESGASYPDAAANAIAAEAERRGLDGKKCKKLMSMPNNVLAVEYLKAIARGNYAIEPIFIPRSDKGYNDISLVPPYASATAIRGLISDGKPCGEFVPFDYGDSPVDYQLYESLARLKLLGQKGGFDGDEGLVGKLCAAAEDNYTLDGIINAAKSKRYTYSRIKRLIFWLTADVNRELLSYRGTVFAKLLAVKNSFKARLKEFGSNILIKASDESRIPTGAARDIYNLDKAVSDLYAVLTRQPSSRFYSKLLTVD